MPANSAGLLSVSLLLVGLSCMRATAQQPSSTGTSATDAILDQARKTNVLTTPGAPPFRAFLDISSEKPDDQAHQGSIDLVWADPTHYRFQIQSPSFRQLLVVQDESVHETNDGYFYPTWLQNFVNALLKPLALADSIQGHNDFEDNDRYVDFCIVRDGRRNNVLDASALARVYFNKALHMQLSQALDYTHSLIFKDFQPFHDKSIAHDYRSSTRDGVVLHGTLRILEDWKPDPGLLAITDKTPSSARILTASVSSPTSATMPEFWDERPPKVGVVNGSCNRKTMVLASGLGPAMFDGKFLFVIASRLNAIFYLHDNVGVSNCLGSLMHPSLSTRSTANSLAVGIWRRIFQWARSHILLLTSLALSLCVVLGILILFYVYVLTFQIDDPVPPTNIEEIFLSDAPVMVTDDDRLGQVALVNRLARFLQNPKTSPPLVIALQARWGMGKSSVMRMLQSKLEKDKAAVTVWFNAWHHQKEDQLLAYLLETVQKEAVPRWSSAVGIWFRVDLIRIRLLSNGDRLIWFVMSLVYFSLLTFRPDLFRLSRWLTGLGAAAAALPILQILTPFKTNPEKLAGQTGGLISTLKELVRLPSLVGKSDVRQEFANNLSDVVNALNPQRLVIFLDDLDRCKPDRVVEILEAINFLSSAAQCIILVGADYEKVETLIAMEFEKVAVSEAQNLGGTAEVDVAAARVAYARNYLRKIINLRLNLRLPDAKDVALLLRRGVPQRPREMKTLKRIGVALILGLAFLLPPLVARWLVPPVSKQPPQQVTETTPVPTSPIGATPPNQPRTPPSSFVAANGRASNMPLEPRATTPATAEETRAARARAWLVDFVEVAALPGSIIALFVSFVLSRPAGEFPEVDQSFGQAIGQSSEEILRRCDSPREVRRFMNYLRLIATEPIEALKPGDEPLRLKFKGRFDLQLIQMAALGVAASNAEVEPEILDYFIRECDLFGLDPETFTPRETFGRKPGNGRGIEERGALGRVGG